MVGPVEHVKTNNIIYSIYIASKHVRSFSLKITKTVKPELSGHHRGNNFDVRLMVLLYPDLLRIPDTVEKEISFNIVYW